MKRAIAWSLTTAFVSLLPLGSVKAASAFDPLLDGQEVRVDAGRVTIDLLPSPEGTRVRKASTWWEARNVVPSGVVPEGIRYSLDTRLEVDGFSGWPNFETLIVDLPHFRMAADAGWQIDHVTFTLSGRSLVNPHGNVSFAAEGEGETALNQPSPVRNNQVTPFAFSKTLNVDAESFAFQEHNNTLSAHVSAESSAFCSQFSEQGCLAYDVRQGLAWVEFDTLTFQATLKAITPAVPEPNALWLGVAGLVWLRARSLKASAC